MDPTVSPSPNPTVFGIDTTTWDVLGTVASIIGALATIVGLIIGGWWAYSAFIRNREKFPKASLTHVLSHLALDPKRILFHAEVTVSNAGRVLLKLGKADIRVGQVLPLIPKTTDEITNLISQAPPALEIYWPVIAYSPREWTPPLEIEPGESHLVVCDFIFPPELRTVQMYTWFKNMEKPEEIGWELSTLYDLEGAAGHSAREVQGLKGSARQRA